MHSSKKNATFAGDLCIITKIHPKLVKFYAYIIEHTMAIGSKTKSILTFTGTIGIILAITLLPVIAEAQVYYDADYYYAEDDMGYYAYESEIYEPFAPSTPPAHSSSQSHIAGRKNIWEDEYEEKTHPGDPLPLGDHTILYILSAITAMVIFFQQRKRAKQPRTTKGLLSLMVILMIASPALAQNSGDYRVQYVEQYIEKYQDATTHQWKNRIVRTYTFESDIIAKRTSAGEDTVSMHIYQKVNGSQKRLNHPEIILQRYDGSKWVDIEAYMVFGPLKASGSIGLLPERKDASGDSEIDDYVYSNGIENILNDPTDNGCGVWNFILVQDGTNAMFDMTRAHRYTGKYYIRAASAEGGYNNYNKVSHEITLSEYAKQNYGNPHDYTHYFCDAVPANTNVTFTIANDYSTALAKPLKINNNRFTDDTYEDDIYVTNNGGKPILPAYANVRYSWDIITNRLTRAYIGETKQATNEYLVVHNELQPDYFKYFQDNTDWMYSVDISSLREDKAVVRAKYNNQDQFIWGTSLTSGQSFIGGTNDGRTYPLRLIYDFKDHRLVTIYKPDSEISGEANINTPVMIHREHNAPATQITFATNVDKVIATGDDTEDKYTNPAYAVLTFLEDKFATNATTSHYEKMFYWVSFPFDVNLKDVFGLGAYGDYWAVQYYDGAKRALEGLPTEASTGWEYVAETKEEAATKILKANTGYVVCLNYKRLSKDYNYAAGGGRKVSLYFPSANRISPKDIQNQANITVNLEEYPHEKTAWNHWNWHLLGVPSYANPDFHTTQGDVPFFYQYWHPTDGYAAVASDEVDFYAMHAYMVQYEGEIEWSKIVNTTPSNIAAKKNSSAIDKTMLRIELLQADKMADKTYVQLRDEEGTLGFDLNLDLTKIINKGANIYTVVNGDKMAGNIVPADAELIPLGVVITEAGEYSFTMPSNTNGAFVEFIDYERSTTTNLLAMDYIVNLPAGTLEGRFALRIQPNKVVTSLENIGNEAKGEKAKKYLIDGALYLLKDGVLYDAQGHYVQ